MASGASWSLGVFSLFLFVATLAALPAPESNKLHEEGVVLPAALRPLFQKEDVQAAKDTSQSLTDSTNDVVRQKRTICLKCGGLGGLGGGIGGGFGGGFGFGIGGGYGGGYGGGRGGYPGHGAGYPSGGGYQHSRPTYVIVPVGGQGGCGGGRCGGGGGGHPHGGYYPGGGYPQYPTGGGHYPSGGGCPTCGGGGGGGASATATATAQANANSWGK